MAQSELELEQAEQRMTDLRASGYAVSARYDRRKSRIVVDLNSGVQFAFPPNWQKDFPTLRQKAWLTSKSAHPAWDFIGQSSTRMSISRPYCKAYLDPRPGWRNSLAQKADARAATPKCPLPAKTVGAADDHASLPPLDLKIQAPNRWRSITRPQNI